MQLHAEEEYKMSDSEENLALKGKTYQTKKWLYDAIAVFTIRRIPQTSPRTLF